MELGIIYTLWLRELKRFWRSKSRIFGNLSMPFIWLVIMGIGISSSVDIPGLDSDYFNFVAPGVVGMSLLFSSIFSGVSVIWEKQFGFLKEILVAPVTRTSIVFGKIIGSATISLINGILVLLIAIVLGGINISFLNPISLLLAIVFMLLISFAFVSIGLAIATKLNNMEGFQMIMSFLVMPVFFLSGAFFPMQNVPVWMKALAFFDPLKYGVDGLRGTLIGVSELPVFLNLAILIAFAVTMVMISSFLFNRMSQ